jgi:hypothetical protein
MGVWLRLRAAAGGNWTSDGILQVEGEANFRLSWAHEAHPKTTLYGVVFQKSEWVPACVATWIRGALAPVRTSTASLVEGARPAATAVANFVGQRDSGNLDRPTFHDTREPKPLRTMLPRVSNDSRSSSDEQSSQIVMWRNRRWQC